MRDICIDVTKQSGNYPSGQQGRVTFIDLKGLDLAVLEKILFINSPIMSSIQHKLISEGTIIVRRVPGPTGI